MTLLLGPQTFLAPVKPMDDTVGALRGVLEAQPEVRLAYLFGSTARGEATARSDLDVAVLAPALGCDAEMRLRETLSSAAGRSVDLVLLGEAPPLLCREIIREGVVLLCRAEDEQAGFELSAIMRYLDTRHLRELQYAYLRGRVEAQRDDQD